jgi:hypothetical protein
MQTLKISRQLSNLRLPLNLEIHHQKAYFNYNHWYKSKAFTLYFKPKYNLNQFAVLRFS